MIRSMVPRLIEKITKLAGKSHRAGLHVCNECREHFTVTVGSVMERSHLPLTKWAAAFHLMAASKKGVSAHQLMRMLGIGSYRSAWFLAHRVREAMRDAVKTPLGGSGKVVEADETYFGKRETPLPPSPQRKGRPFTKKGKGGGSREKIAVVGLVERGGKARMIHVERADKATINQIVVENIAHETRILTDESRLYNDVGTAFIGHETVKHSGGEYVRYDDGFSIHTNTVENVFSVFKRGMHGVYQHCGEAHLHRYLAEFEFRFNNRSKLGVEDAERTARAVKGAAGKRLTYHQSRPATDA
jgi:transposase-like protein